MPTPNESALAEAENRVIAEKTAFWQEDRWAERHLRHSGVRPGPAFRPIFAKLLSVIPERSRVLDVGCGHGRLSIPLAEAGHTVVATDVSAQMLELLRRHCGNLPIEIRQGDAHRLAAADGEFDAVISYDFLPHFPDWPRLLAEKARACRPGGKVVFGFNFAEHRSFAGGLGRKPFEHAYSTDPRSNRPFWAECSLEEMARIGEGLGLTLVEAAPIRYLLDSYAFGAALGTDDYRAYQGELTRKLEENPAVADFYEWLETRLFQRLPFFAAYSSLVVFQRGAVAAPPASRPPQPGIDLDAFLAEIPSETSPAERKLLFDCLSRDWDGTGQVVEIGPFLGGTTRAIACGMEANPRRTATARLHTFDRFDSYYAPDRLRETVAPLVASGALSAAEAETLTRSGNFRELFDAIHRDHGYHALIRAHNAALPESPDEIDGSTALSALDGADEFGVLFIDGCKSWASTHYAMRKLLPRTPIGAPVIFQDLGWYTCFWIGAFVQAADDLLELERWVDSTYLYRLRRRVSSDDIAARFPRTPEEFGTDRFKQTCLAQMRSAVKRNDPRGGLVAQLHYVAALATIGRKADAARVLAKIDPATCGSLGYMVEGSRRSPTYLPGNRPILWNEA